VIILGKKESLVLFHFYQHRIRIQWIWIHWKRERILIMILNLANEEGSFIIFFLFFIFFRNWKPFLCFLFLLHLVTSYNLSDGGLSWLFCFCRIYQRGIRAYITGFLSLAVESSSFVKSNKLGSFLPFIRHYSMRSSLKSGCIRAVSGFILLLGS